MDNDLREALGNLTYAICDKDCPDNDCGRDAGWLCDKEIERIEKTFLAHGWRPRKHLDPEQRKALIQRCCEVKGWRNVEIGMPQYCPKCGRRSEQLGMRDCPINYHYSMLSPM